MSAIHIMIDLESKAITSHPALFQIGAVKFSTSAFASAEGGLSIDSRFVSACTMDKAIKGDVSDSTMEFWAGLPEVLKSIEDLAGSRTQEQMLQEFVDWVNELCEGHENPVVYIYGNGAAEDCVWLVNALADYGLSIPNHSFRTNVCFRTLKTMAKEKYSKLFPQAKTDIFSSVEVDTEHDALCDAIYQVKCLSVIMQLLDLVLPE